MVFLLQYFINLESAPWRMLDYQVKNYIGSHYWVDPIWKPVTGGQHVIVRWK